MHRFTLFNHVDHKGNYVLVSSFVKCNPDLWNCSLAGDALLTTKATKDIRHYVQQSSYIRTQLMDSMNLYLVTDGPI